MSCQQAEQAKLYSLTHSRPSEREPLVSLGSHQGPTDHSFCVPRYPTAGSIKAAPKGLCRQKRQKICSELEGKRTLPVFEVWLVFEVRMVVD